MASFNLDPVLMISNAKIWIPNKWDFYSIFVNNVYFYIYAHLNELCRAELKVTFFMEL